MHSSAQPFPACDWPSGPDAYLYYRQQRFPYRWRMLLWLAVILVIAVG